MVGLEGSEIMAKREPIHASIDQEETGECHMLILHQNEDITKCEERTFGNWAYYCHNHYLGMLDSLEENEKKGPTQSPSIHQF